MDKLHQFNHNATLRDLLESQSIKNNDIKICRKKSNSRAWNYSGIIELEIMQVYYNEEIIKIKYLTTLPEHFKQGDIVWLDFSNCDIFEIVNID